MATMIPPSDRPIRVGLIGCGAIGQYLVGRFMDSRDIGIIRCWDVQGPARERISGQYPSVAHQLAEPNAWSDDKLTHLVEAAHPHAVPEALAFCAAHGWRAIIASVGGLVTEAGQAALQKALQAGVVVQIPSGAIGGLDILKAIPKEALKSVTLRTRKPPKSLPPEEAVGLTGPTLLYEGWAREAIARFPKNVNVAATLSLAGLGIDATRVEIWGDPGLERNTHEIHIDTELGTYLIQCANLPMPGNPGTSFLAALSIAATLQGTVDGGFRVGS